jgi:hypothetical protein
MAFLARLKCFYELEGPYDSILECHVHMACHLVDSEAELRQLYPPSVGRRYRIYARLPAES